MKKKIKKLKIYIFMLTFLISVFHMFKYLESSKLEIKDKTIVKLLLKNEFKAKDNKDRFKIIFNTLVKVNSSYSNLVNLNIKKEEKKVVKNDKKEPIIYIYNTHQSEEYNGEQFMEYNIKPTVMMSSYIMEEVFNKNNYTTIVEEESISQVLKDNRLNYAGSYKASRILMEQKKKKYAKLKYFIDVHRDSLTHDKTSIKINDKDYAKLLFIVGLENNNYKENLKFTEMINDELNKHYPNLSRGIYKKEGPGVNGVYNQDNNKYTILIEVGGRENTIDEVMNSSIAFTNCFMNVVKSLEVITNG